jgi:hypothetical protein
MEMNQVGFGTLQIALQVWSKAEIPGTDDGMGPHCQGSPVFDVIGSSGILQAEDGLLRSFRGVNLLGQVSNAFEKPAAEPRQRLSDFDDMHFHCPKKGPKCRVYAREFDWPASISW